MTDDVLIAFLLSFSGISALVGERGYPYGLLPQSRTGEISADMPAFTVNSISEQSHHTASSDGRPELDCYTPMRFQIDIYANDGAGVVRLSRVIKQVLDGFTGVMSSVLVGGAWGRLTTPIERIPENLLFHRTMDFEIHAMGGG